MKKSLVKKISTVLVLTVAVGMGLSGCGGKDQGQQAPAGDNDQKQEQQAESQGVDKVTAGFILSLIHIFPAGGQSLLQLGKIMGRCQRCGSNPIP